MWRKSPLVILKHLADPCNIVHGSRNKHEIVLHLTRDLSVLPHPSHLFRFHPLSKILWYQLLARSNVLQSPHLQAARQIARPQTVTHAEIDLFSPESCTPLLAICTATLAAYLQSMSQRQVSHSDPILTCNETGLEVQQEARPWVL